jgi:hypothetical protein
MRGSLQEVLVTGAAALLFAAIFLFGGRLHTLRARVDRRSAASFGAGMAAAYVFIHLMPEMHEARQAFAESVSMTLRYQGMAIYFVALVGFLTFYGVDHLRRRRTASGAIDEGRSFRLHVGGFAAYVCLMAYLLVNGLEGTPTSIGLYALAIAFHFYGVDQTLREEHGTEYVRVGRLVLAAMCVAGWAAGLLVRLPPYVLALLVAFISGAIIMNSAAMELPSEKDGRFMPFVAGGVLYGLLLLPLK